MVSKVVIMCDTNVFNIAKENMWIKGYNSRMGYGVFIRVFSVIACGMWKVNGIHGWL